MNDAPNNDRSPPSGLIRFLFLRSTLAILLIVGLTGAGVVSYGALIKESIPDLAIPQAIVVAQWPGADPETMENQVTNTIEEELRDIDGLKTMSSASYNSFCSIAVEFQVEVDIQDAMARLRAKVSEAEADLPSEVKKPTIRQVSVNDLPVMSISLFGEVDEEVRNKSAKALRQRLEKLRGVNEVTLGGYREEVVRIRLLTSRLVELGIPPTDIARRLKESSVDRPLDRYESPDGGAVLVLYGRFRDLEALKDLPLTRLAGGRLVRLADVAEVELGMERETNRAFISWHGQAFRPAVDVSITRLPGADTLQIIQDAKAEMEKTSKMADWPTGLKYRITQDQSVDIWDQLNSVVKNGWQAILAVFLVLIIAMSWREATIAGLAIPLTFLGALAGIYALGYTLNQMVIVGMVLSLGLLVDVFILMMEGMHDGVYGRGESFVQAAMNTVKTYAAPAFAGQLTTILAFAPLMAIGGVDGKFIRIIPMTGVICLALSYIIALFVCIPMSKFLLKSVSKDTVERTADRISRETSSKLEGWLQHKLLASRGRAFAVVFGSFGTLAVVLLLSGTLPVEMYPEGDSRNLGITIEMPPDTTLDQSQVCADSVGESLRQFDVFESVTKFVGKKSPMASTGINDAILPNEDPYYVGFSVKFTLEEDREKKSFEYMTSIREKLDQARRKCPGSSILFFPETTGASGTDPIDIQLVGDDIDALREASARVRAALSEIPGAVDVRDNLGPARLTLRLHPDREAINFHGLTVKSVADRARIAMAEDAVITFPVGGVEEDIDVLLGTGWPTRHGKPGGPTTRFELQMLQIATPSGESVPLVSLVWPEILDAPIAITRSEGFRTVSVLSKVKGRTTEQILADLKPELEKLKTEWPADMYYWFAGEAQSTEETFGSAANMLFLALFLVFAVLVIQFDSFRQPFIMMLTVPLALVGTFGFFLIGQVPISFPGFIGIIALVGIVVNNAIVMISAMNALRDQGLGVKEAASKGAASRLRPILSTTLTTLAGLIPLTLSSPMWFPLASAIIAGLIASTVFAMVVVPSLYLLLTKDGDPQNSSYRSKFQG
ncbi:MAG: efflux RND transporter permease subunit [Proteobacteria bacterium]|nr:efflux RND transporter permease subunit [Pseudomonadota bacterium]